MSYLINKNLGLLVIIGLVIMGCRSKTTEKDDPFLQVKDLQARDILKKAIDIAGGLEKWEYLDTLEFQKRTTLLLEDGSTESDTTLDNLIRLPEGELYLRPAGQDLPYQKQDQTAMDMAIYTVGMPFKLLDEGTVIDYIGKRMVDGQELHAIEARYNPEENENHSSSEVWTYYFSTLDYSMVGAKIISSDHRNLLLNRSLAEYQGLRLVHERQSYRIDEQDSVLYLRAEYLYEY